MKVLAIDAATKISGVAVFDNNKLIYHDIIKASSTDVISRINKIVEGIKLIIEEYSIEKIILEEVRPDNSPNSNVQKKLIWLQAGIEFMIHNNFPQITIEYVYPSEWRKLCGIHTGRGIKREHLKKECINFINKTYNLNITSDDEADAIGIGHSYINKIDNEINWE